MMKTPESLETKHVLQGVPEVELLFAFHNLQQMLRGVHVFLVHQDYMYSL